MPPAAKGKKSSKFRSFKKKLGGKKRKTPKKTKSSKPKKSKNTSKALKEKKRTSAEKQNRKLTKERLRKRREVFQKREKEILDDPYLSLPEKGRKIKVLRRDYDVAQRKTMMNYRRRKATLRYAGRSYASPYPYGGVFSEILAGGLATTIISSTTANARPASMPPYPPGNPRPMSQPPGPSGYPLQGQPPTEPETSPKEEKQFPYNEQEMRTLAHHNTVAGRCVKSLEMVKGGQLVAFLNARDDYMNELDPEAQITKGLQLMNIAKQLDTRYGTHAMAWGKVMRYRPSSWSREMAQMFADGADAKEMTSISDMSGAEVTKHLSEMDYDKLQEIYQYAQSCTSQTIGCSMDAHVTENEAKSDFGDRFVVYFANERKQITFHLNGFIEINSFVSEREARQYGIDRVVKVLGRNAIVKNDIKTKCDHQALFSQVRMLRRMLSLLPDQQFSRTLLNDLIKDVDSFATPDNEIPVMWFGADYAGLRFLRLAPIVLTPERKKSLRIGDGDLTIMNDLVAKIMEITTPYVNIFAKEFPTLAPPQRTKRTVLRGSSELSKVKKVRS
jgi:hypothetical protein